MRLLTYTALRCPAKGVANTLPLLLEISEMNVVETEVNPDFIKHILPSLNWEHVLVAARAVNLAGMPDAFSKELLEDNDFVEAVHRLLLDIHILSGSLICQETGKRFPIEKGQPDMMYACYSIAFDLLQPT
jgi:multifunctional methyltransferase subunit TRM112